MNTHTRCLTALAAIAIVVPSAGYAQETGDDEQVVRATVERFKDALANAQADEAVALLHPDVRIFEGGHAETREEYRSGHLGADMAFLAAVESNTTWSEVDVSGETAVFLSEYTASGTFREREIDAHGTETILLVRSGDGWLIRHIHWSSR